MAEKRRVAADSQSDTDSMSKMSGGSDANVGRRGSRKSAAPAEEEEDESKSKSIRQVGKVPEVHVEKSATQTSKRNAAKRGVGTERVTRKSTVTTTTTVTESLTVGLAPTGRQLPASIAMELNYDAEEGSDEEMVRGADDDSDASFVEESDSEEDEEAPAMEFEFDSIRFESSPMPAAINQSTGNQRPQLATGNQQPQSAHVWNLNSRNGATSIPIRMVSIGGGGGGGGEMPRVDSEKKGILFKLGMEGSYRVILFKVQGRVPVR